MYLEGVGGATSYNLAVCSMGMCEKYLCDLTQTFTDISALTIMNMCNIITIHLNHNETYANKIVVTVEPGMGSKSMS